MTLDAIRSTAAYWQRQGWIGADPSRLLQRRKPRPDRSRALSRAEVEQLLAREDISLRERTMWRMLYETAARSAGCSPWTLRTWTWPTAAPVRASSAVGLVPSVAASSSTRAARARMSARSCPVMAIARWVRSGRTLPAPGRSGGGR